MVRRDPRRGAALLTVLVFAAFLSLLAAAASRTALSGARAARAFADAARADALGRTAADALAYRIATGDAAAKRGGAVALRLPEADVIIDYASESARVDANLAPVPLIAALLAAVGAEPAEAEAAGARVARLRADAAAKAQKERSPAPGGLAALRAAVDAMGPARAPQPTAAATAIRDTAEIAAAWGLSDALARRVLPSLTVSNGTATVDPVLAGRDVVLALVGDDARADDYLNRRRTGFVDRDSALALLPLAARDFASFEDAPSVRAIVRVRVAGRLQRRYELILAPPPAGAGGPGAPTPSPASPGGAPVAVSWRRLP